MDTKNSAESTFRSMMLSPRLLPTFFALMFLIGIVDAVAEGVIGYYTNRPILSSILTNLAYIAVFTVWCLIIYETFITSSQWKNKHLNPEKFDISQ